MSCIKKLGTLIWAVGKRVFAFGHYVIYKVPGTRPYPARLTSQGTRLVNLGRYEEALIAFDGALAIKPAYLVALYNKGIALLNLERYEDALAVLETELYT